MWHGCDLFCQITLTACYMGNGGGGHWLVRMEWRPAGWSVCLPVLISPCTIKFRSSLLAPAHLGGPGKRAVKRLWCGGVTIWLNADVVHTLQLREVAMATTF